MHCIYTVGFVHFCCIILKFWYFLFCWCMVWSISCRFSVKQENSSWHMIYPLFKKKKKKFFVFSFFLSSVLVLSPCPCLSFFIYVDYAKLIDWLLFVFFVFFFFVFWWYLVIVCDQADVLTLQRHRSSQTMPCPTT